MPGRLLWLLLGLALLLLLGASVLTGDGAIVAAAAVLLVLVAGFALLNVFLGRHQRDTRAAAANRDDAVPSAHLSPEGDDRPLGDTPEAHDEISPHDLPMGHPGRAAAERQAGGADGPGTTTGNRDGGAAGAHERIHERS